MTDRQITVLEARRDFGNLVLDALAGQVTVVTRYGKPAAIIGPVPGQAPADRTAELAVDRRAGELAWYFQRLMGLAEKAGDTPGRADLFDRIERVIAAMEALEAGYVTSEAAG